MAHRATEPAEQVCPYRLAPLAAAARRLLTALCSWPPSGRPRTGRERVPLEECAAWLAMPGPATHDDTSAEYEQVENAQLAQDRAAAVDAADVDDATAQRLFSELIDAAVVTPVSEDRVLIHEPSSAAFDSTTQLAVFHRGWTAARDADAAGE